MILYNVGKLFYWLLIICILWILYIEDLKDCAFNILLSNYFLWKLVTTILNRFGITRAILSYDKNITLPTNYTQYIIIKYSGQVHDQTHYNIL